MTEMTLIEALEKLALITKKGLDTLIQIPNSTGEPITIIEAIKAIRGHASDISETDDYTIYTMSLSQNQFYSQINKIFQNYFPWSDTQLII